MGPPRASRPSRDGQREPRAPGWPSPRWAARQNCDPRSPSGGRRGNRRRGFSAQGSQPFEAWMVAFPDKHRDARSRLQEMARAGAQAPDINAQPHGAQTRRRTQDGLTLEKMSPESVVPTSLATALLTEGSGGATDPESASGQEGAIAGPLSAASYSQPCTLPPACSQNTGLVQGSGTGRGVPMPLSMPPCPGLKVEDSAASLSRPLRKGGCGTPAGPPSFPRTSHHYPPTPVPGCPKQGWPPLASRSRPISGRWANTRALESCTTLLTVAFDLTPGPFCGWLVLGMAHVTSLNHLGAWSPHGAARDPKAWRPTC